MWGELIIKRFILCFLMLALVLLAGCSTEDRIMQEREEEWMQREMEAELEAEDLDNGALDEELEVTQSPEDILDVFHEAYFQMEWDEMAQHATPEVQADLEEAKQFFATNEDRIVENGVNTPVDYDINSVDHVNDNEVSFKVTHFMSDGSAHEREMIMEKTDAGWVVAKTW